MTETGSAGICVAAGVVVDSAYSELVPDPAPLVPDPAPLVPDSVPVPGLDFVPVRGCTAAARDCTEGWWVEAGAAVETGTLMTLFEDMGAAGLSVPSQMGSTVCQTDHLDRGPDFGLVRLVLAHVVKRYLRYQRSIASEGHLSR